MSGPRTPTHVLSAAFESFQLISKLFADQVPQELGACQVRVSFPSPRVTCTFCGTEGAVTVCAAAGAAASRCRPHSSSARAGRKRERRARERPGRGSSREGEPAAGAGLRAPAGRRAHVMPLGRWAAGPLGRWAAGPLGRWAAGPLGRWAAGPLGRWAAGPLGRWAAGPLGRWAAGPLGRWAAGPLGRWAAGPLGRWAIIHARSGGQCQVPVHDRRPGAGGSRRSRLGGPCPFTVRSGGRLTCPHSQHCKTLLIRRTRTTPPCV